MIDPARVTLEEGVPLLHAVVARAAVQAGARVLFIKGPVLHQQGLREFRVSSDVDALCAPGSALAVASALMGAGWREFTADPATPQILESHSTVLIHDLWPCAIDLHHTYPGFLAPPTDVFEALWDGHTAVELAGHAVPSPEPLGSALISALNLLRTPDADLSRSDMEFLVAHLRGWITSDDRARLTQLATLTGAASTARPFLEALGVRADPDVAATVAAHRSEWELLKAASQSPMVLWLEEMRSAPPWRWPGIVWRGLTFMPDDGAEGRRTIVARGTHITQRLLTGIRLLPGAMVALLRLRRRR